MKHQSKLPSSDWISAKELARLTGTTAESIYQQSYEGKGPLVAILAKLGSRLGCWREDYDAWKNERRRIKPTQDARPAG